MSAWLRMNATLPLDHRILSLSSDAARWEYVVALCHAKLQEAEGVWANQAHYLAATRQSPERLAELLDAGLLAIDEGGTASRCPPTRRRVCGCAGIGSASKPSVFVSNSNSLVTPIVTA
jgi:hypothetical protein